MNLRPYQLECVDACMAAWNEHNSLLAVMPTGMGKTVVFTEIARQWQHGRVLVVAPQIELVSQAANKIKLATGVMPDIEQANLRAVRSRWISNPFIVASKQTLCGPKKRYRELEDIGLVIIDEADMAITKVAQEMVQWYESHGAKVLGVTATPNRTDGKSMKNMFAHCAYRLDIGSAIDEGWLVNAKANCIRLESLDLSDVKTKGSRGDFQEGELARVMDDEKVIYEIAEVTAAESVNLKTVVYCATVNVARSASLLLSGQYGLSAEFVCGDRKQCSPEKRTRVLRSFAEDPGGVQIVCNVGVLTTGWDFPGLEHLVMARPTRSLRLFTQIFGRGTRPLPGVVDFEGSTAESRKAAIAASAKPYFHVTDMRDNTHENKLVSSVDVLAGEMGLAARKLAKEKMDEAAKAGEARDVREVIAEAIEAQEEFERKERERLAKKQAKAKYRRESVDVFDGSARSPVMNERGQMARMPFGKFKGQPVHECPSWYLKYMLDKGLFRKQWLRDAAEQVTGRKQAKRETNPQLQQLLADF